MSLDRQIQFFELHYKRHPESRFFIPLADLYRRSGRIDKALELLESSGGQCPRSLAAGVVRGLCLQDAGRDDEAGREFREVLQKDPGNMIALGHLADAASERGSWSEAVQLLEKISEADPRNTVVAEALEKARIFERDPEAALPAAVAVAGAGSEPETNPPADLVKDLGGSLISAAAQLGRQPQVPADQAAFTEKEPRVEGEPGEVVESRAVADTEAEAKPEAKHEADAKPEAAAELDALSEPEAVAAVDAPTADEAFATRTMADIYLAQGHSQKALRILRRILEEDPGRQDVRDEIALLDGGSPASATVDPAAHESKREAGERRNRERFAAWLDRESAEE